METKPPLMEFYAIRSQDGKWFRRKGYGGYGENWVDDIKKARIFTKPGGARAQISYYATNFPQYKIPDLVVLKVSEYELIDESHRILKAKQIKEQAALNRKIRQEKEKLIMAQKAFDRAKKELEALQK